MSKKEKHDRFLRVIPERKNQVLECIQALGCCSVPDSYAYDAEELPPIFEEIFRKLAEVWHRMSCHSPYPFIPFALEQKAVLEIDGRRCAWSDLASKNKVLELLSEDGPTFAALEPIRNKYNELFKSELCWTYPFCISGYLGCVLLLVQEGILCLPYTSLDFETYEQFEIGSAKLLTAKDVQALMDALSINMSELYGALSDIYWALCPSGFQKEGECSEE